MEAWKAELDGLGTAMTWIYPPPTAVTTRFYYMAVLVENPLQNLNQDDFTFLGWGILTWIWPSFANVSGGYKVGPYQL